MVCCGVAGCKNNSRNKTSDLSFFALPKEVNIRSKWIDRCGRKGKSTRICSAHFRDEDYEISYFVKKSVMGRQAARKKLKKEAVPSLNLPSLTLPRQGKHIIFCFVSI